MSARDESHLYICNRNGGVLKIGDMVSGIPGGYRRVNKVQKFNPDTGRWEWRLETDYYGIILPPDQIAPFVITVQKPQRRK